MPSSRSSKQPASTATASPTTSKPPDDPAEQLLRTWRAWDDAPTKNHRVNAYVDACKAYAGEAANALHIHLAACRRAGMNRRAALDAWENDW